MDFLKNRVVRNASWIIICKLFQSVLSLIINMITARYLGPSNFGLIAYASSIVTFFVPIMDLGLSNILVQKIGENQDKEGEVLGTSMVMSLISAFFCIVGVVTFTLVANHGEKEAIIVCALYSILLLFQSLNIIKYWFQAKLLSKYTAIVGLISYVLVSAYKIFLLVSEKNIYWFAISNSLDFMIIAFSSICIYKKIGGQRFRFSLDTARRLFSQSKYYIIAALMVTIFAETDKVMIKLMIGNEEAGFYSAAVSAAAVLGVVFSAIIDSARPIIFESKLKDESLYQLNVSRLYCIIIYSSLVYSLGITIFAKLIIFIIYGKDYYPAISALKIIVWYTPFSYIGVIRNIWLLAENKQKYLWKVNMFGAVANVILNYFLIPVMGINGAAVASLITQIYTNVIVSFIIRPIRYNNTLLAKGLNIKLVLNLLSRKG